MPLPLLFFLFALIYAQSPNFASVGTLEHKAGINDSTLPLFVYYLQTMDDLPYTLIVDNVDPVYIFTFIDGDVVYVAGFNQTTDPETPLLKLLILLYYTVSPQLPLKEPFLL